MDHLIGMQLEASYRREVAERWAKKRNLLRMARAGQRRESSPTPSSHRRVSPGQQMAIWLRRHARRSATVRSSA